MSRKHLKRYLMLLSAVGLLAIGTSGSGTFASFNAEVANPGNYFATGTIYLHATKQGGTGTCKSESDATNNQNVANTNGCDALFTLSNLGSGATGTVGLTLDNAGSINASKLQFALGSACTTSKSKITKVVSAGPYTGTLTNQAITVAALPSKLFAGTTLTIDNGTTTDTLTLQADATANATSITVNGSLGADSYTTGAKIEWGTQFGSPTNLCSNIQVYVEEDATLGGSPIMCLFGGNAGTANTACTFGGTGTTAISGIGTTLASNSFTNATLGSGTGNTAALDAGMTRFFKIGYQLPAFSGNNQGNQDQNTSANFDLKWHIEQ